MNTYLFILFSFLWGNLSETPPFAVSSGVISIAINQNKPEIGGIDRIGIIKQVLVKTFDNLRRRIGWWSELLTITAVMWGVGALLKVSAGLLQFGGSWADYTATLLFIGGGVFFLIWFFQMSAILN